jgi:hypothetical protein
MRERLRKIAPFLMALVVALFAGALPAAAQGIDLGKCLPAQGFVVDVVRSQQAQQCVYMPDSGATAAPAQSQAFNGANVDTNKLLTLLVLSLLGNGAGATPPPALIPPGATSPQPDALTSYQPGAAGGPLTSTTTLTGTFPMFSYTPGGESYGQFAKDVTLPKGETDCGRVWQASNGVDLAWTFLLCDLKQSSPSPRQQWQHPTQLVVTDPGVVRFKLYRDAGAVAQLKARGLFKEDPYVTANTQKSRLGLGWFVDGVNAAICVNGACQILNGGGVYQIGFPQTLNGFYDIELRIGQPLGQIHFWQGEKATKCDNWVVPGVTPPSTAECPIMLGR